MKKDESITADSEGYGISTKYRIMKEIYDICRRELYKLRNIKNLA